MPKETESLRHHTEPERGEGPRTRLCSTDLVDADEDLHTVYLLGYHKRDNEIRRLKKAVERLQTDMRIISTWARNDATSGEMRYRAMRDIENRAEESLRASTAKGDTRRPGTPNQTGG